MKAVIFDMDGVIVDTMDLHYKTAQEVLNEAGANVTLERLKKFDTTRSKDAFSKILSSKSDDEVKKLVDKKYKRLFERTKGIKPIPGFPEFFSKIEGNYKLAVVSSSITSFVEYILSELGIKNYFDAIVGGDMISKGKPDPEGFLTAAKMLKVKPQDCLVIEDSIYGVMSAKVAGMKCIAVTNTYDRNFLLDADLIVDSLAELTVGKVEGQFNA